MLVLRTNLHGTSRATQREPGENPLGFATVPKTEPIPKAAPVPKLGPLGGGIWTVSPGTSMGQGLGQTGDRSAFPSEFRRKACGIPGVGHHHLGGIPPPLPRNSRTTPLRKAFV